MIFPQNRFMGRPGTPQYRLSQYEFGAGMPPHCESHFPTILDNVFLVVRDPGDDATT